MVLWGWNYQRNWRNHQYYNLHQKYSTKQQKSPKLLNSACCPSDQQFYHSKIAYQFSLHSKHTTQTKPDKINTHTHKMHWTNVRIAAFIVCICITRISGDNNGTHTEPISISTLNNLPYNQSKSAVPLPIVDNFTDLLRLEDVLMVFDLKQLANKWPHVKDALQPGCSTQMTNYFRGLQQRNLWAIKSMYTIFVFFCSVFVSFHFCCETLLIYEMMMIVIVWD